MYSPAEFRAGGRIGGEVIIGPAGDLEFAYTTNLDADGIYDFERGRFPRRWVRNVFVKHNNSRY